MKVRFIVSMSNIAELFRKVIAGEMTIEQFRKAPIVSKTEWRTCDIKEAQK